MDANPTPTTTEPTQTRTTRSPFALRRESLRELTPSDLGQIAGGVGAFSRGCKA